MKKDLQLIQRISNGPNDDDLVVTQESHIISEYNSLLDFIVKKGLLADEDIEEIQSKVQD